MVGDPHIRAAKPADGSGLARLLPGVDPWPPDLLVAESGGEVVGAVGLKPQGEAVLLHAVAVRPDRRGRGIAARLIVTALEAQVRRGVGRALIGTGGPSDYFRRFGFQGDGVLSATLRQPHPWVRRAGPADVPAITRIYNEGIADRIATLEDAPHPEAERAQWLHARGERHPVIVAIRAGGICGWASLNPFSPRAAYRHVADFSIYVERAARGGGIGSLLLGELIRRARDLGYHKLVLSAFPFNAAGMALYTRFGFQTVGILHEQGMLDQRWVDTIMMERLL